MFVFVTFWYNLNMKIVVIGSGKLVKKITNTLSPDIKIYGIFSRNKITSTKLAKKVNAKIYNSLDEIKSDKEEFDFAYVVTPHTSHFEYAKFCLINDINVLVEKPLVTTLKDLETLIELSKTSKAYISEAMWSFICDPLNEAKNFLRNKKIKEANLRFSIFKPFFNKKDRLFNPSLKGGALFDIGIYLVTIAYMFFGVPLSTSISSVTKKKIDVIDTITLNYNGFKVNLYTSFYGFKDTMKVVGDGFILSSNVLAHAPNKIKIKTKDEIRYIKGETSYNEEFRKVYTDISNGLKFNSRISLLDNLNIMKIMEELDEKIIR